MRHARSTVPLARYAPGVAILVLTGPLVFGLAGTILPAFGVLPVLGGMELTLTHFSALFAMPGIWRSAASSVVIGLATTLVALGFTALFVAGYVGHPAFARVRRLISPLLAVPHAAAAFGLAFLIAPSGFLIRLAAPVIPGLERPPDLLIVHDPMGLAMMAGLIVKEIPFLLLVSLAALPQTGHAGAMRLARSFGYGRVAGFFYFVWPKLYGQIRLAVIAVIAYSTSVVDVAFILGPQLPATLPVRLTEWMNDPDLSMRHLASAGAVLQLAATLIAILAWLGLERIGGVLVANFRDRGRRLARDRWLRRTALGGMTASAALVFSAIAILALWSVAGLWQFPDLMPQTLTLRSWAQALPRIWPPLATTLVVALAATAIAVVLVILSLSRELETGKGRGARALLLLYLPLIVPQISFMFGLQYLAILTGVEASLFGLVAAHLIFVLPYVFLSLSDPWRAHDRRYDAIAAGLGMSRTRTLVSVRLPMLLRAVLTAAAVGFAVSIGQYLPTVLIGTGRLTTLTSEAVALSSGGNRRVIGVYAFLQTVLPFLGFAIATALPGLLLRNRRGLTV